MIECKIKYIFFMNFSVFVFVLSSHFNWVENHRKSSRWRIKHLTIYFLFLLIPSASQYMISIWMNLFFIDDKSYRIEGRTSGHLKSEKRKTLKQNIKWPILGHFIKKKKKSIPSLFRAKLRTQTSFKVDIRCKRNIPR